MGQAPIARLVPKLGSDAEVALYRALETHRLRSGARPEPSKAAASDIVGTALSADVFVAGKQVVRDGRVCSAGPRSADNGVLWPSLASDFTQVMTQLWT